MIDIRSGFKITGAWDVAARKESLTAFTFSINVLFYNDLNQ